MYHFYKLLFQILKSDNFFIYLILIYRTHADGVKLLTGGISSFLESNLREAIVPIVDEDDIKFDGAKLLGFVMIQGISLKDTLIDFSWVYMFPKRTFI